MPEQRSALWSNPAWPNFDRLWLKEETPSRKDGICEEEETDFHWTYVHLLSEAGSHIPLPAVGIAAAATFWYRFWTQRSLRRNHPLIVAIACLFLAGKTEDAPRSLRHITHIVYSLRFKHYPAHFSKLSNPEFFENLKEAVATAERALLFTLGFEFNVKKPFEVLVGDPKTSTSVGRTGLLEYLEPALGRLPAPVKRCVNQCTWNLVNDSYKTTLCIQYNADAVAVAAAYLAMKLHKVEVPERMEGWPLSWGVKDDELKDIVEQLMDLYKTARQRAEEDAKKKAATSVPPKVTGPPALPATAT